MDPKNLVLKVYENIYDDRLMHDINFHKKQVKKMYKSIIRVGFNFCAPDNIIANYVKDSGFNDNPFFVFKLMNAQHFYARSLGFLNWSDLRNYCNV